MAYKRPRQNNAKQRRLAGVEQRKRFRPAMEEESAPGMEWEVAATKGSATWQVAEQHQRLAAKKLGEQRIERERRSAVQELQAWWRTWLRQRAKAEARKQVIGTSLAIRGHVYALLAREPPATTVVDGAAAFVAGDADEQALEAAVLQAKGVREGPQRQVAART